MSYLRPSKSEKMDRIMIKITDISDILAFLFSLIFSIIVGYFYFSFIIDESHNGDLFSSALSDAFGRMPFILLDLFASLLLTMPLVVVIFIISFCVLILLFIPFHFLIYYILFLTGRFEE